MNGNVARGHGGCCGKFPKVPIVQSAVQSLENQHAPGTPLPHTVKSSVINTRGLIDEKYRWMNRPFPYATVKSDNNQHLTTSSDHTRIVQKKTLAEVFAIDARTTPNTQRCFKTTPNCLRYNSFYRKKICNFTQPESDLVAISSGEYIQQLDKKCAVLDETAIQNQTRPTHGAPMACGISA